MKLIFTVTILIISTCAFSQNPYVGTWTAYDILSFKNIDTLSAEQKKEFSSFIVFKEDMTFEKNTNGTTTHGKYEFKKNKFRFLEKDHRGIYKVAWEIRWPKNTLDPMPDTLEIDLSYPELFKINGKYAELDVYYIKKE
ncbi:hypothetical protein [Crocinitomix catalasitica]|uniref:hypothetical protein n=1 Tax=Crocinitomix catalasitica TaxID=184607 RepID=UPI0012F8CD33|nr:hypothetical protein [Crocinitomix catalasitica]